MKIYIEKNSTLQIEDNIKLILLNVDEFVSTIKKEFMSVPVGHIKVNLKYKLVDNTNEYNGESIVDTYNDITNTIEENSPYKVELVNWKLSDDEDKYLEFNFIKKNNFVEITRDNYKNYEWNETTKYQYRGLEIECDHEYDAGTYMMWIELPVGVKYKFKETDDGDVPYQNQFSAGMMFGTYSGPYFIPTIENIMDYVDKYYDYLKPYIK
jgi:hypothetical protein